MTESTTVPVKTNGKLQPFGLFGEFEEEMQRLLRWPFALTPFLPPVPRLLGKTTAWAPRMDVFEKDGTIVVKVELPGLKKEDVLVQVVGEELVISGESKAEKEVKEHDYYRCERSVGRFYRRLLLPAGTTAGQITATLTDGVLEVQIPEASAAKPAATQVEVR
jgi:HSP20 family protein